MTIIALRLHCKAKNLKSTRCSNITIIHFIEIYLVRINTNASDTLLNHFLRRSWTHRRNHHLHEVISHATKTTQSDANENTCIDCADVSEGLHSFVQIVHLAIAQRHSAQRESHGPEATVEAKESRKETLYNISLCSVINMLSIRFPGEWLHFR